MFLLAVVCLILPGCSKDNGQTVNKPLLSSPPSEAPFRVPIQTANVQESNENNLVKVKKSPIEYAQKEYLDAYNDYVRLLRESGPQTIETLQALALYQKKYQIYQMILKAEKN